jgi:hypothetical protein
MTESVKRKREPALSGIELKTAIATLTKLVAKAGQNKALDAMARKPTPDDWDEESDATILTHVEGLIGVLQAREKDRCWGNSVNGSMST